MLLNPRSLCCITSRPLDPKPSKALLRRGDADGPAENDGALLLGCISRRSIRGPGGCSNGLAPGLAARGWVVIGRPLSGLPCGAVPMPGALRSEPKPRKDRRASTPARGIWPNLRPISGLRYSMPRR